MNPIDVKAKSTGDGLLLWVRHSAGVLEPSPIITFGRHLRRLRRDRDLSQEALAEMASLSRVHLSAIERGKKVVGLNVVFALAEALGIPPSQLFTPFDLS